MRLSKEEQARREGMSYALRVAKKKGIDGLEAELKSRNALNIPVRVSKADLDKFSENVREQAYSCILILMLLTLHDEFGFGTGRLNRARIKFNERIDCMTDGYCTWQDHIDVLKEECGMDIEIVSSNEEDVLLGREGT